MKKSLTILLVAVLGLFVVEAQAQIKTPAASPSAKVKQTVGLTDITVEYSRPSMKGRSIFGANGLVSYGKKWRTGANAATKITFSDDITISDVAVKKGSYAILTVPSAASWAVEFHPYEGGSWSSYQEKTPAATMTAEVSTLPFDLETFLISFDKLTDSSADLEFMWENKVATLKLSTAVDEKVMAAIQKVLNGPTANDYYAAGQYYLNSGRTGADLEQALEWVQKATKGDTPRFWQVRRESQILAKLGRFTEAITAAKKSLALATEAGNQDYIRINNDAIAKWMKM